LISLKAGLLLELCAFVSAPTRRHLLEHISRGRDLRGGNHVLENNQSPGGIL